MKRADWLDAGRVRAYAVLVALASLMILAFAWPEAMGRRGAISSPSGARGR